MAITKASAQLRDPAKTAEYYAQYLQLSDKQIQQAIQTGPRLLSVASEHAVRSAKAAYSVGDAPDACAKHMKAAVDYWQRYMREGSGGSIRGIVRIDVFLETLAAASLTDQAAETVAIFSKQFTGEQSPHWHKATATLVGSLLAGTYVAPTELDRKALAAVRQFLAIPALCQAIGKRDPKAFHEALEDFLVKGWAPVVDRAAKGDLALDYPAYFGKWSLLSAALCRLMGSVPPLSKKALQYVPTELAGLGPPA